MLVGQLALWQPLLSGSAYGRSPAAYRRPPARARRWCGARQAPPWPGVCQGRQGADAGVRLRKKWLYFSYTPEVIWRVAQERDCDLIVVGSHGLIGSKRLMLGSISNAVVAKAPCPVLVVKLYEG
jgi:hypothetical protein